MPASKKKRADEYIFEQGFAESRTKAQALILAGEVFYRASADQAWQAVKKAGQPLPEATLIEVRSLHSQDVGRGAQKIRRALDAWTEIQIQGCGLDIGASTGGFTQVLLERGASKVVALDVGTHQLHERLRSDPRVVSLEQHHVLKMDAEKWQSAGVAPPFDIIVTDVSFMSAVRLVSTVAEWLKPGASWIVLVKPQFEVGPKKAPGGIVKNPAYHQEAILGVRSAVESARSLEWKDIIESPIKGGDGNKEFLAWIRRRS